MQIYFLYYECLAMIRHLLHNLVFQAYLVCQAGVDLPIVLAGKATRTEISALRLRLVTW